VVQFTLPKCVGGNQWSLLLDTNIPDQPEGNIFKMETPYAVTAHSLLLFELQTEKKKKAGSKKVDGAEGGS
jgi:isoamylase